MLPSLPPAAAGAVPAVGPRTIAEGDMVVVYESPISMRAVYIKSKDRYDNKFGSFAHKDWIGLPFGSKVFSRGGSKGWVHLLAPSPDLWSQVLRHRTQILYVADISMAVSYLELRPGSVVLESGTGSGSLTHSLIRAVAPTGHVHTFEFHPERAAEADKEFARHGLSACVTVRQRNIEELGFPHGGPHEEQGMVDLTGAADAVFLDLPAPHKVVPSAAVCLRPDGRLCSFSPCIEQVQRTCEALERAGFTDLQTLECLLRTHEVRTERLLTTDFGGASASSAGPSSTPPHAGSKRPRDEPSETQVQDQLESEAVQGVGQSAEQAGTDGKGSERPEAAAAVSGAAEKASSRAQQQQQQQKGGRPQSGSVSVVTTRPAMDARGHTGYLTFARKFVVAATAADVAPIAAASGQEALATVEATEAPPTQA